MYVVTDKVGLGSIQPPRMSSVGRAVSDAIMGMRAPQRIVEPAARMTAMSPQGVQRSATHVDRVLQELQSFVQGRLSLSVVGARDLLQRAEDNVTRLVVSTAPDRDEYLQSFRELIPDARIRIQSMVAGPSSVAPEAIRPPEPIVHVVQPEPSGMSARNLLFLGVGIGAVLLGARYVMGRRRTEMIPRGY